MNIFLVPPEYYNITPCENGTDISNNSECRLPTNEATGRYDNNTVWWYGIRFSTRIFSSEIVLRNNHT